MSHTRGAGRAAEATSPRSRSGSQEILIRPSTYPAELVRDPLCGSGGVGAVARAPRRRALLCDVNAATSATRLRVAVVAVEGAAATRKGRDVGRGFRHAHVVVEGAGT